MALVATAAASGDILVILTYLTLFTNHKLHGFIVVSSNDNVMHQDNRLDRKNVLIMGDFNHPEINWLNRPYCKLFFSSAHVRTAELSGIHFFIFGS